MPGTGPLGTRPLASGSPTPPEEIHGGGGGTQIFHESSLALVPHESALELTPVGSSLDLTPVATDTTIEPVVTDLDIWLVDEGG